MRRNSPTTYMSATPLTPEMGIKIKQRIIVNRDTKNCGRRRYFCWPEMTIIKAKPNEIDLINSIGLRIVNSLPVKS